MRIAIPAPARMILAGAVMMLATFGCTRGPSAAPGLRSRAPQPGPALARLGFTIQAGAFSQVENAARLADTLQGLGLNAVYYASSPDAAPGRLYRVRFGDFPTRAAALAKAEALRESKVIQAFYIVAPEEPPLPRLSPRDGDSLRANLVDTAGNYLGVPYLWGGASGAGFDCSGLTMAIYRLNGLQLPRSSRDQFAKGSPVPLEEIQKGDLLFFATGSSGTVSHVGIYIGGESFIHAPKRGRMISKAQLAGYYRDHLVGARSYL